MDPTLCLRGGYTFGESSEMQQRNAGSIALAESEKQHASAFGVPNFGGTNFGAQPTSASGLFSTTKADIAFGDRGSFGTGGAFSDLTAGHGTKNDGSGVGGGGSTLFGAGGGFGAPSSTSQSSAFGATGNLFGSPQQTPPKAEAERTAGAFASPPSFGFPSPGSAAAPTPRPQAQTQAPSPGGTATPSFGFGNAFGNPTSAGANAFGSPVSGAGGTPGFPSNAPFGNQGSSGFGPRELQSPPTPTPFMPATPGQTQAQQQPTAGNAGGGAGGAGDGIGVLHEGSVDGFLGRRDRPLRAILFTKKPETPAVWSRVAEACKDVCAFGVVRHTEARLLARFHLAPDDLPKVMTFAAEGSPPATYSGPNNFERISIFVKEEALRASGPPPPSTPAPAAPPNVGQPALFGGTAFQAGGTAPAAQSHPTNAFGGQAGSHGLFGFPPGGQQQAAPPSSGSLFEGAGQGSGFGSGGSGGLFGSANASQPAAPDTGPPASAQGMPSLFGAPAPPAGQSFFGGGGTGQRREQEPSATTTGLFGGPNAGFGADGGFSGAQGGGGFGVQARRGVGGQDGGGKVEDVAGNVMEGRRQVMEMLGAPDAAKADEAAQALSLDCESLPRVLKHAESVAYSSDTPKHADAYYHRAADLAGDNEPLRVHVLCCYGNYLFARMANVSGAERQYKLALDTDPRHVTTCFNFGVLLEHTKRFDAAERMYRRALRVDPRHQPSMVNYAVLLQEFRHDFEGAESLYERMIVEHGLPGVPASALCNYANLLSEMRGQHAKAEELYRQALAGDPGHITAKVNRAWLLYAKLGRIEEGERELAAVARHNQWHAGALSAYGAVVEREYEDYDKAEELYQQALRADPWHVTTLCRYGGLLAGERGEWELAERVLQRAVSVKGDLEGAARLLQMLKAEQVAQGSSLSQQRARKSAQEGAMVLARDVKGSSSSSSKVDGEMDDVLRWVEMGRERREQRRAEELRLEADKERIKREEERIRRKEEEVRQKVEDLEKGAVARVKAMEDEMKALLAKVREQTENAGVASAGSTTLPAAPQTKPAATGQARADSPPRSPQRKAASPVPSPPPGAPTAAETEPKDANAPVPAGQSSSFGFGGGLLSALGFGSNRQRSPKAGTPVPASDATAVAGLGTAAGEAVNVSAVGATSQAVPASSLFGTAAPSRPAQAPNRTGEAALGEGVESLVFGGSASGLFGWGSLRGQPPPPGSTNAHQDDAAGTASYTAGGDDDPERELDIHFKPAIEELPPEVERRTGEEDESVLLAIPAKLYRFATDGNEWKERGRGEVKILRHSASGKTRLLMRRSGTMKVCANHQLSPALDLQPMPGGAGKAWTYATVDHADAEEGATEEVLAFRFKTEELADEFKSAFADGQRATAAAGDDEPDNTGAAMAGDVGTVESDGAGGMRAKSQGREHDAPKTEKQAEKPPADTTKETHSAGQGKGVGTRNASPAPPVASEVFRFKPEDTPIAFRKGFWEVEGGGDNPMDCAPLLNRNAGFLRSPFTVAAPKKSKGDVARIALQVNSEVVKRAMGWPALPSPPLPTSFQAATPLPETRILHADAERTFKDPALRKALVSLLERVADGDYHQGLGYVTSFTSLMLPPDKAVTLLRGLSQSERYCAGYWKAKPEAFARDAMVFERLLRTRLPTLAARLRDSGVVPEAYAQKWFCGLCVHVLPFKHLVTFFERFLARGWTYLLRFALGLTKTLAPRLEHGSAGQSSLYLSLLRLDATHFPDDDDAPFEEILAAAEDVHLDPNEVDKMRGEEMAKLQERMKQVRAREAALQAADDGESAVEDESSDGSEDGETDSDEGSGSEVEERDEAHVVDITAAQDKPTAWGGLQDGGWHCSQCFTPNNDQQSKCAACGSPRAVERISRIAKFPQGEAVQAPAEAKTSQASAPSSGGAFIFGMPTGDAKPSSKPAPAAGPSFKSENQNEAQAESKEAAALTVVDVTSPSSLFPSAAPSKDAQQPPVADATSAADAPREAVGVSGAETGEEEEDMLFKQRAKLFRYADKTREWKERGVGDIKLLVHRKTERVRVLMRRDHTFKVCANHYVTPDIELKPMAGSNKAWTYYTTDFSGINEVGEETGEVFTELFALRFKDADNAKQWHDAFERCQRGDLSGFSPVPALSDRPVRRNDPDVDEDGAAVDGDATGTPAQALTATPSRSLNFSLPLTRPVHAGSGQEVNQSSALFTPSHPPALESRNVSSMFGGLNLGGFPKTNISTPKPFAETANVFGGLLSGLSMPNVSFSSLGGSSFGGDGHATPASPTSANQSNFTIRAPFGGASTTPTETSKQSDAKQSGMETFLPFSPSFNKSTNPFDFGKTSTPPFAAKKETGDGPKPVFGFGGTSKPAESPGSWWNKAKTPPPEPIEEPAKPASLFPGRRIVKVKSKSKGDNPARPSDEGSGSRDREGRGSVASGFLKNAMEGFDMTELRADLREAKEGGSSPGEITQAASRHESVSEYDGVIGASWDPDDSVKSVDVTSVDSEYEYN